MENNTLDRNLLFGILALQTDFVQRAPLLAAIRNYVSQKSQSLGQLLVDQGALTPGSCMLLEGLMQEHLKRHENDPRKCLSALESLGAVREQLLELGDGELQAALGQISTDAAALPTDPASESFATRTLDLGYGETPVAGTAVTTGQRFRIVRPHAKGGLGEVFVAIDGQLNRQVALKHIQDRHADDTMVRNRFLLEAEITGGLEHPSIVPVYGLGVYPDGRPYYAMRFIRGDSMMHAIRRFHGDDLQTAEPGARLLELRKLLNRFINVCNAIEYAHSRGVLHRDLKPSNIMLGKFGETLVVDWGLAKPRSGDDLPSQVDEPPLSSTLSASVAATEAGSIVGTPQFMSPEQANGQFEQLGPASDIYSLGATLYCLLTGKPPIVDKSVDDILKKVRQGEFPRPREHVPQLHRGLEKICLKALALEPADRYESARELADDIEHWLADEPVSAFREPWSARFARWCRRHRTAVQVGGAALVVITAVAVASAGLINRARQETEVQRGVAATNFRQARDGVDRYYTTVSENRLLQQPGMQGLRKDLLDDALAYYQAFIRDRAGDPKLREELGAAYFRVGKITGEIGSKDDAMNSLEEAVRIQSELLKEQPDEARFELDLSNSWNEMGRLEIQRQRLPEAKSLFEKARDLRQHLVTRDPKEVEYQRKLANSLMNLGAVYGTGNQLEEALKWTRQAIGVHEQLAKQEPNNALVRRDLAKAYYNLALLERRAGRPVDALADCRRALALYQQLYDEQPQVIEFQGLLTYTTRLADELAQESGKNAESLAAFEDARRLVDRLVERNPLVTDYQAELAVIWRQIGQRTSDPERSLEAYGMSRDVWTQLAQDNPAVPRYQADLATSWLDIGQVELQREHRAEALKAFEQALDIDRRLIALHPAFEYQDALARALIKVALIERALPGRLDAAQAKVEDALRIYSGLADKDAKSAPAHEGLSRAYVNLALISDAQKKTAEAVETYRQAIDEQRLAVKLAPQAAGYRENLLKLHGEVAAQDRLAKRAGDALVQGLEQQRLSAGNGPALIAAARSLALTAAVAQSLGVERAAIAEQAQVAAVAALRDAVALKAVDAGRLAADPDFAPLKDRPDFQALGK